MRLHELERGKTYLGEDGKEYEIVKSYLCLMEEFEPTTVTKLGKLTQNFTPKKVKRTVTERGWLNKYPHGKSDCYHSTKEQADRNAASDRIACVHMTGSYEIEIEEE